MTEAASIAFRNMRGEVGQNWVGVQQKTFLKWLNHQLGDVVDDINLEQLDNGVFLIQCVEKLTEKKIGRYQKNPRGRFQKLENINLLLKFLKAEGFNLVNIGASDIESCNPKIILGLLWKIISRYQIGATKPTDPAGQLRKADPQKDLMTWVDNTVTGYGIAPVQNFKSSFKDGRRLAALVDSLEPGSMDMKNLGDPLEATRKAMDIAHKKHGVPKLMEAEDLITNPEPHSVMTYLSEIRNAKEKPRLPGRLPAPRPEEKIVVATGKSSSLAPMEQVLKRGKSPENSVDLLNYMRTPQFNFPNVKALIRAFNQAAKEEEKIKGQMLKWLNRNRDRAVKEKAYVRNTPRPEVAILYEQGRAGPRTMQHLRNLLAQGKTAPTLEDLAELIRQEEEKGNKLSEKEKEYLRKMLMDKNAGLWDEDDPYALQLKKMQPKELDKLYNVAQSVTGAMTYIRQIAQETKDKKRPPMRSPPDLPRAVKELADKDKKVIAGFLKSPEAKLLAPLAKKQLTAADVDTLFREGGAGARTIAHLHALNKAGKSFEELDDLIPALKQMENQALAKDAKDPAAAASAILGDVQLQALRRGKDDYATGAGTGGDAPVDAPRIVMTWHAGPKTEKERQDEAAKEALNDFLNDPLCPLFTPEGNQKKRITPKDMDALFEIEKSGPGTGALLNALQEQGTKVDSFPELLAAAKDLDDRNRDALQDYLNDPETKLFNDPSHADVDRNDVARLMEESGAGPATLPLLQQLEGKGQKFRNVDDMIPAVKKLADERRALPKSALSDEEVLGGLGAGGASAAVAEALNDADQLPTDIEKLRDYLNHPDTGLLDDAKSHDYPDAQLQALADAAKGVDNAIDLLEYLNNEGQHYTSVPELKDALPSAVPKRDAVKKRVKDLLNDKPKGLLAPGLPAPTDRDVDDLYNEAKAGPKTAAALRAIADDDGPKRFNSVPELTDAVKAKARKRKKRDNDRKQAIEDYLKTPDCPAFSPAGNKDKKVDPKKVNDLFRIEQSGPGTVALLNALEAEGTKPSSVPELIAAAKTLSDKKRKGLQEHLADAKTPALKDAKGRDAKADSTPPIAALVTEESEGGPATTVGAKMVDAEGKKVNKSEDLIPLIKKALKKKRNVPQSSLTPEERAAGLGLGSASKGVGDALAEQTPEDDRNALYDYLTSPDVGLLASADIDPKDLDAILAQADGAKDAIDKLEYLDHEGKRYPGVQDLADHVPESDPKRDDVKEQLAKILKDPKKKVVASGPGAGGSPVSPSDLDKLYEKAEAGPRTAAHLREAAAEAKTPAKNLDELAKNLNDAEKKAKDRKRKAKAALKDYLDSPDCPLFTPFGKQTKPAATKENVNDLFSPEKSGPGTAALLDALAAQGQQFDSIPELLDAAKALSAQKRKELKDHLADPACPVYNNAKDKVKPDSASAARLAEESEAGPLTLPIVKELEAARTKVNDSDDLIPLVKKHVSKKPKGPAARALEAGIKEQTDEDAKEREALKDYLTSPDTYLLPDSEEKKLNDEALAALIAAEDGSFPDTLRALDELNEDGREFKSIPELLEAVKDHKLQTAGVKADMKELLDDPRREIYAPASSTDPLTNDDVGAMYDRGDVGLDSASVLNNLDQTKPYNNKDDLIDAYKDAARKQKQKKKHDKEALKDYLSDPDCPIFTPEENKKKHITPHDVNQVYAVEKSGPGTGAMLKAFQDEGKHFNSIPELLAAAKDYHDKREKKAKEGVDPDADRPLSSVHDIPEGTFEASVDPTKRGKALADDNKGDGRDEEELMTYLGDPTTKLLSGKPRDYHDGRDVEDARDLLAAAGGIEEALPLLEQLEADGKHYDSIPDMMRDLPYAKAKQAKKHKEVRDYLNDPRTNLVPASAKPGTDSKADAAVDDLVDHGGAGPDTLPILKELAGEGKTYPTLDALGEAIKQKRRGKKKNNNDDIQKLKDYLSGPDCELLQDAKDPSLKNDELADLLDEGDGLDNTLDLLNYLNDDGKHYDSVPDITKHLKDALPKRRKVKDRMQNLINDPAKELLPADAAPTNVGGHPGTKNEPITDKDVEDLYHAAKAGPDTAAALRELADDGKHFNSLPELEQALKDNARKQKKKKKEDKAALKNYLEDPSCPALTPAGNKDKKVTPHDVNNLFKNEKSGPGTVALLNALEDAGKKGSSIPDLLAAAKDLSKKKRKELQDHLNDAKCPAFNSGPDVNRDASPEAAEILAKETGAGPATLADLKGVEAGGKGPKVNNTEDLIPFIKDQHKKRKDLPKSALNSDEKKGGDGVGAATKAFEAAAAKRDPEADRNALLDYLQNRDNGLLDDPSTLAPKDMDAVLSEADGAKDAIDLCEYHDHDGDRYPTIENLGEHLREAEPLRDDVKNQLKDLLNDPKNHLLPTESGPVTAADVDKIYNDAEAGPRTAAHLRELAAKGKEFKTPDDLVNALKDAERAAKRKKRKDKAALREYLNSPDCAAFTPAGNQRKPDVSPADVNDLYKNEKSGPGTAALLDALEGKKYDSVPDLIKAAADLSDKKRKELKNHLQDPRAPVFSEAKDKDKAKPTSKEVDRLAEESEAGPASLPVVKELEGKGTKVQKSDDLIPLVKEAFRKKPKGAASKALEAGPSDVDNFVAPGDAEKLMDYLASPDVGLLDGMQGDMQDDDLKDALLEGGGLTETLNACKDLDDDGRSFDNIPDLVDAIKDRRLKEEGVKQELKDLLEDPDNKLYNGEPLTMNQVDNLYDKAGGDLDAAAHLRELAAEGKFTSKNLDDIADALKDSHRKAAKDKKKDKEKLREYLSKPDCPLFTPAGNKNKDVTPQDVNKFYGIEETGPGTGALLNALEESGKKFDSLPDLLAAAKDLSDKRQNALADHLADPTSAVQRDDDHPISASDADKLAKESTAGPATLELMKQLEAQGKKFDSVDDLIPEIKKLHDKKRKVPKSSLTPQERVAGVGPSPLDGPVSGSDRKGGDGAGSGPVTDADVEAMLDYLRSPDNDLLDGADNVEVADVRDLLEDAGGLEPALALCDYLQDDGKTFNSVPELTKSLPLARSRQAKEKKDIKDMLNEPRNQRLLGDTPKPLNDNLASKIHDDGHAGPKTTAHIRELAADGKAFGTPDQLADAIKDLDRKEKRKKRKQKQALQNYLDDKNCDLLTPAGNQNKDPVSRQELNDLWRNEKSGPGTAALLNELKASGQKFDSIPDLLDAAKATSGKKRKELKDKLGDPRLPLYKDVKDKNKVKPTAESVARLAEESEAGPKTAAILKELADMGKTFDSSDDMIPFVKKFAKNGLGPLGAAMNKSEDNWDDIDKLKDYLSSPDCNLLDDAKEEIKDKDLSDMLDEGVGLDNTIDLCEYLNKDGLKYPSVPALTAGLDHARPKRRKVKDRMKDVLNEPLGLAPGGTPVNTKAAEDLYADVQAGPQSAAAARALADKGEEFPTTEALTDGLKLAARAAKKQKQKDKADIKAYLERPDCPAFSPSGNKAKGPITTGFVNDLYRLEQSGPGTIALLNALEENNKQAVSVPELYKLAKEFADKEKKKCSDHVGDAKAPIFNQPAKGAEARHDGARDGPDTTAIVAEESEAGPATLVHIKELEKAGESFPSREPLIQAVKKRHYDRKDLPKTQLTKEERLVGLGVGSASGVLKPPKEITPFECEELMEYLADPETELLDDDQSLKMADLEALLLEADGDVKEAIDLCEHLNHAGKRYNDVPDLTDHLKDALPMRKKVKQEMAKVLQDPSKTPLNGAPKVSDADIDKVYKEGQAGPRSAAIVRDFGWDAKDDKSKGIDGVPKLGEQLQEEAASRKRKKKVAKLALRDYLNSPGCPAWTPAKKEDVTTGDINALYRLENSAPGTIALLNSLEAQKKKFDNFPALLGAAKSTSNAKRRDVADFLSSPKAEAVIPAAISPALTATSGEVVRLAEESYAGPVTPLHLAVLAKDRKQVPDSDELIPLIRKLHNAKKDSPFAGLSIEEGLAGLGDGSAGRMVNQKMKEKEKTLEEDVEALMEYLASEECYMMNEVKELEPDDLRHLLNVGYSLAETLNLCKWLNHQCCRYDSVPELTEAIREARTQAFAARREGKEMISSSMNHILPGWGEHLQQSEISAIFDAAECGLGIVPYLRELLEGRREYKSQQELSDALYELHNSAVVKRRNDLKNIRDWMHGLHGETCALFPPAAKTKLHFEIKEAREFFRIELSSYGTAALLKQLQVAKKSFADYPALLAGGRAFSDEKRAIMLKQFSDKKNDIFAPMPGKTINVTAASIKELCEESTCGPNTLVYVNGLASGRKKYLNWEDIYSVVKRLNAFQKDPYWILKEGDPPKKPKPQEVVEVEHWNVDALAEYLRNPESKLLKNKKDINDKLLVWLLREGKGIGPTLRHLKLLDKDGAQFDSIRSLTIGVRRAIKTEEDIKAFLTKADCKLLSAVDSKTPTKDMKIEHAEKLYETVCGGIYSVNILEQMARETKSAFPSMDALIKAAHDTKEAHHDAVMDILGEADCVLLNSVDNITTYNVNEILQSSGAKGVAQETLKSLNDSSRTFFNVPDLCMAVRKITGIAEVV